MCTKCLFYSDETVDLIEETNDEVENWIYYNTKDSNNENNDMNTFNEFDDGQKLIYIDPSDLVTTNEDDDNEQTFQYDVNDTELISDNVDGQDLQVNESNSAEDYKEDEQHDDIVDDLSKHNLILKETIDENGQLVEGYLCQECNLPFNTIEDFLNYHPCMELLSEIPEKQEEGEEEPPIASNDSENKLWDLVENLEETDEQEIDDAIEEIIEMKHKVEENDNSNSNLELDRDRYFCYDCQQVFSDLSSAENHECKGELENADNVSEVNAIICLVYKLLYYL